MSKEKYLRINEIVQTLYNHILLNTEEGENSLAYIEGRGFTKEIIDLFKIGCSYKGNLLQQIFQRQNIDFQHGLRFGLLKEYDNGQLRDTFAGRLMIPLRDENGKVVGFSGRVLPGNNSPAKYLNTSNNEFFEKGNHVFNLDLAKAEIKKKNAAILMEGYFDVMAAFQFNLKYVVAVMGTALTPVQMNKLGQYTNRLILCLDGDKAGFDNAKRNAELLIQNGFEVRIAIMPTGYDPHEFLMKYGKDSFVQNVIKKAVNYYEFIKLYSANDGLKSEADKMRYIQSVLSSLSNAPIEEQRKIFSQLANEFQINLSVILQSMSNVFKNHS